LISSPLNAERFKAGNNWPYSNRNRILSEYGLMLSHSTPDTRRDYNV
jgi:hypothetical protein